MGKRDMLDPVGSCLLTDTAIPSWGRYDTAVCHKALAISVNKPWDSQ